MSKFRAFYLALLRQSVDFDVDPLFPCNCHCSRSAK